MVFLYKYPGITIKELLNIESLKGSKVLAGEKGLDRKIIKLNVMEVPDIINWVGKGEFLLTTAYHMRDDAEQLRDLIIQLEKKGLAGMGIKTKRYINSIPDSCLHEAERLAFPLIEVPYQYSFSIILTEALTEIINTHINTLGRIENIQNKFINVMLGGGSLKEIAMAIYSSIGGNSIAIQEYFFQTKQILCDKNKMGYIEAILEAERPKSGNMHEKCDYENNCVNKFDRLGEKKIKRYSIPICSANTVYGCIFIWEDKKPLSPVELTIIESSTSIIALDIYKKISMFGLESKHKIEFFEDLFSGSKSGYKKAMERADYFKFDTGSSYSVINIALRDNSIYMGYDLDTTNKIKQLKMRLLKLIEGIKGNRKLNLICGAKSNNIIILFGTDPNKKNDKVKQDIKYFCEEILRYAKYECFNDDLYIGVGRNYQDIQEIWKSNKEANRAIEYQKKASNDRIIYYDELGIHRILSFEGLEAELDQFYMEMLEPLVKYDREKGTELILTLTKYFENEGNISEISEKLFVHYNTVVYRLQRIKEIIGMDLEDYNNRLNLQISLKILEMYSN